MNVPVFIMPCFSQNETEDNFLLEAVSSVLNQQDPNFLLLVIDDCSPSQLGLKSIQDIDPRLHIIKLKKNKGAAYARNVGTIWAKKNRAPFILYNDADDLSHPERLSRSKELFHKDPKIGLIYSSFEPIDEHGIKIPSNKIPLGLKEILESFTFPPQGKDAWIKVALEIGYVNLTSATSVKIELAIAHPFPLIRYSEDTHTWYRMMADTDNVVFDPSFPTKYRVPSFTRLGSSSRDRYGEGFCKEKINADIEGFKKAIEIAVIKRKVPPEDENILLYKFCLRLSKTLSVENNLALV